MSSNGISGMSNISTDTLHNRYEKSIKQYNKLIEINRQLKDSNTNQENQIKEMSKEINLLKEQINELDNQNNLMDEKYMELTNSYEQLQIYSKKIQEELANNDLKYMQYDQELQHQNEQMNLMIKQNEYIQNQYEQAVKHLEEKQMELDHMQEFVMKINEEKKTLQQDNMRLKNTVKSQNIQDTMMKLQSAQINIQKLIKECNDLKSKEINSQGSKQKEKMKRYITLNTNIQEQKEDYTISHLIYQYKSKIKHLQEQNKQLLHKAKIHKSKLKDIQKDYQGKIMNLQRLTQKQQKQIQKMIQRYDNQLMNIHNDNKKVKQLYFQALKKMNKKNDESHMVLELKRTNDIIFHENQSLKKINYSLKQERESHIKETAAIRPKISKSQSIEMVPQIPELQEDNMDSQVKLKYSDVQTDYFENQIKAGNQSLSNAKTFYETSKANPRIPITVRYSNHPANQSNNFKFIQSVNIINGFNVNMGQNPPRSKN